MHKTVSLQALHGGAGHIAAGQIDTAQLVAYLDGLLAASRFADAAPNGLQVAGNERIGRILCGVTASEALIDAAIAGQADAILVHHGYFWKGEAPCVVGIKQQRLRKLLEHGVNLLAWHLPLDAHPALGNNAQLGLRLGLHALPTAGGLAAAAPPLPADWADADTSRLRAAGGVFGEWGDLNGNLPGGLYVDFPHPQSLEALCARIAQVLGYPPRWVGENRQPVRRLGWCTGGAQSFHAQAIEAGCDVYLSGEGSEKNCHLARESHTAYIAAGHYATERYGVWALGEHLAQRFGLICPFHELDNPF